MINNLEEIKKFLAFDSADDFYYLQILQRKKENSEIESNSRVIKNYYVTSIEYLESHWQEITDFCTMFNARAMLRLNKRSFEQTAWQTMQNLTNCMSNKDYKSVKKVYDRACGLKHNDKNKKWILDIDDKNLDEFNWLYDLEVFTSEQNPVGSKLLAKIPTKNGFHIISSPFDTTLFKIKYNFIEIHKDNPINLFIP
jgi:hypothetical protein